MDAIVLVADWAEAINGKLYIQGGGWTRVALPPQGGLSCSLAIRFLIGWDETNRKHDVVIRLVDEDRRTYQPTGGPPVEVKSQIEVGRPAGILEGADLDGVLAVRLQGLPLEK